LVSDGVTVIVYAVIALRVLGRPRFDFPLSKLFRFYLPLEFAQIVTFAQSWFDRALLIAFVPLATLGIYNAAVTAYGVVSNVSVALGKMLFPALSSIRGRTQSRNELRHAIRLATRYSCLTVIPIDFLLLATAKPAVSLLIGKSYISGSLPLAIFCAADAITVFATAMTPALLALEETTVVGLSIGVSVPVGLAIAYVLLPGLGIVGAAAARAVVITLIAILQFLLLRRKTPLDIDFRTVTKILLAGAVMAVLVGAAQLVHYSDFMLPIYGLIGMVIYLLMLRFLKVVDAADLDLMRHFLGKRFSIISRIIRWALLPPGHRE